MNLMCRAWYYIFRKHGKTITVISRLPVNEFERIHNCWIDNFEVVGLV